MEFQDLKKLIDDFITSNPEAFVDNVVDSDDDNKPSPAKRPKTPKIDYWQTKWGLLLRDITIDNPKSRAAKIFRRRFRVPYRLFRDVIVPECERVNIFGTKVESKVRIPLQFKILIALRILGRGKKLIYYYYFC